MHPNDPDNEYTPCPNCDGSGEGMVDGSECLKCRGSGEWNGEPLDPYDYGGPPAEDCDTYGDPAHDFID